MTRLVMCRKYQQELEGLAFAPFPGVKGQALFDSVSKQAWQEWLKHQTMLINENHLNVMQPENGLKAGLLRRSKSVGAVREPPVHYQRP